MIGKDGLHKPADGQITSPYGRRTHPITGEKGKMHNGIDISGVNREIRAMMAGRVTTAKFHNSYGNYVVIDHGPYNNQKNVKTLYAHMSEMAVSPGETVKAGQSLGTQGKTGSATGIHLHFELKINDKTINPTSWINF